MSRLTRDGTTEPVSRDQILRRERGQGNIHFPCSAHHEQDWQPYPVDPYYFLYVMTIHIILLSVENVSSPTMGIKVRLSTGYLFVFYSRFYTVYLYKHCKSILIPVLCLYYPSLSNRVVQQI